MILGGQGGVLSREGKDEKEVGKIRQRGILGRTCKGLEVRYRESSAPSRHFRQTVLRWVVERRGE